jgi:hypothetical protein
VLINYPNWKQEEKNITWDINSRTLYNKHIKLTNSQIELAKKPHEYSIKSKKNKQKKLGWYPLNYTKELGASRLKLKIQYQALRGNS